MTEQESAWVEVYDHCLKLGMGLRKSDQSGLQQVKDFISEGTKDRWIEYAKQKPTKEDFEPTGSVDVLTERGKPLRYTNDPDEMPDSWRKITYWRRITPPQPAKPKSVDFTLTGDKSLRILAINEDGSIKLKCGEEFSAGSIDAFIKARLEVTKKDL